MALPHTTYIWELGIDWDLLPGLANASYMPGGFILTATKVPQRPRVFFDQTITFRIFDLNKINPVVSKIESFAINPQIAVKTPDPDAPNANINPLHLLQPVLMGPSSEHSCYFGDFLNCWSSAPVRITAMPSDDQDMKFLLNFIVQVTGNSTVGPILRTFIHDPEMIVGSNG